jgi:hypothetical protein
MITILHEDRVSEVAGARADGDALWLPRVDVDRVTGWDVRPEGLCRGAVCIPVPPGRAAALVRDDAVDIAALWRHAGHPVVRDEAGEAWVLGTGAHERRRALQSLEAPDFALPDLAGRRHALSDHRGAKVLLVTWASW